MKKIYPLMLAFMLMQSCFAQNMYTNLTNDIAVNSMAQDGPYLWFATTGGVFKYDTLTGNVQRFDVANSPFLNNEFKTINVAGTGKKIFSDVSILDQTYDEINGWSQINFNSVNDFFTGTVGDGRGRMWAAGTDQILFFNAFTWQTLTSIAGFQIVGGNDRPFATVDNNTNTAWIYYAGLNEVLKCDANDRWSAYTVPAIQNIQAVYLHANMESNVAYNHNSAFYLLNQPAGLTNVPTFGKMEDGIWSVYTCPLIVDHRDYLIAMNFMDDGSIKIPHGYINEMTGQYYYGVYLYANNTWREEFHITGTVPFQKDSLIGYGCFMAADYNNNLYYAYGGEPSNYDPLPNASGLWKLSPSNNWSKVKISNVGFFDNSSDLNVIIQDTAGTLYKLFGNRLDRFMPDNTVTNTTLLPCIDSTVVEGAAFDSSNNLWLAVSQARDNNWSSINDFLVNKADCSIYPAVNKRLSGLTYYKDRFYTSASDSLNNSFIGIFSNGSYSFTPFAKPTSQNGYYFNFAGFFPSDSLIYGIWFVNDQSGNSNYQAYILYSFNNGVWHHITSDTETCQGWAFDTSGHLWVSTTTNLTGGGAGSTLLYRIMDTTAILKYTLNGSSIRGNDMAIDKKDVLTIWTWQGMFQLKDTTWVNYPLIPEWYFFCNAMYPRNDGSIILLTGNNGITIFNPDGIPPAVPHSNTDNVISGKLFYDDNFNGIQDGNERPVQFAIVTDGNNISSADWEGHYSLMTGSGPQTIRAMMPAHAYALPADTQVINFAAGSSWADSVVNFACHIGGHITDVSATVANNPLVPGGDSTIYWITYNNIGSDTVDARLVFMYDSSLTILSVGFAPDAVDGDSAVWSLPSLAPGDGFSIPVTVHVDSTDTLNQPISAVVIIYPIAGDSVPQNNVDSSISYVVSSYDPNEKEVSPTGSIDSTTTLTYTVRFQNTGTYKAGNVVITDSIDKWLDLTTFKMQASSASYTWAIQNRVLTIKLNNINLPDKATSAVQSCGFIQYTIKPLANTVGKQIKNTANIYFDYNRPVQTNTTNSPVEPFKVKVIPVPPVSASVALGSEIYPNPNKGIFKVLFTKDPMAPYTICLIDITGKVVYRGEGSGVESVINCPGLSAGVYTYQVIINGYKATGKIVVM